MLPHHVRSLFAVIALLAIIGCVSHDSHVRPETSPATVQKQEADPVGQWLMGLEFSLAVAMNDAQNPILPDDDLISGFQKHRATFEQLHQMIVTDSKLHRVDVDWTDPRDSKDAGVPPERITQYRQLLQEVGCRRGFCAYPGRPGMYFISGAQGMVVSSLTKGYCYFEGTPDFLVTNTATYRPKHSVDSYEVFRHIEGHWYVYFDSD